jgi:hypothetical protein
LFEEADLRQYLLGQATEPSAERLEIQALDDEDFFATLGSVEDDLFDDYARGSLADAELQPFLMRYGAQTDRIRVARALAARGAQPRAASSPSLFRYWMVAAAAACLAGVAAVLGTRAHPAPPRPPTALGVSTPGAAAQTTVALLITLGTSRSAAPPPTVRLTSSTAAVQLHVRIDPADVFDRYAMGLRSDRGVVVWHADAVKASAAGGDLTLAGDIPAAALAGGSYELTVRGSTAGSRSEVLGFAAVKVDR